MKFLTPKKAEDLEKEIEVTIENNMFGDTDDTPKISAKEIIDLLKKRGIIVIKKK